MISQNIGITIIFMIYLSFMLLIGLMYYKKTESLNEYVLGGRNLNGWVTALSSQASDMSGWLLMGFPGYAYLSGLESIWIAIGLGLGTYLNWQFIAMRLRNYTEIADDSITISSFLKNRFEDPSNILKIISAILILVFFTIYTASGLVAGGKLFSTVFGIPYIWALIIGALVVVIYTFLGGFMAVCWTDFFQGTLMIIALIIVPAACIKGLGGSGETLNILKDINMNLLNPMTDSSGATISAISIISLLAWGLGYFGQPHILVRFMAISEYKELKKAKRIAVVWVAISLAAAVIIGLVGRAYLLDGLMDGKSETVFMIMVTKTFPTIIGGFMLAAILAAIMSTADSQLLVTSSALTEDIYTLFRKEAKDKELVTVSRIAVMLVAVIAVVLALNPESSVLDLVSYAWAGFGAGFGPSIIMSLFWRRMTRNGALAGLISGGAMVIIWKQLSGGIFDLYEIVPGMIISFIFIIIVSLMDKEPSDSVVAKFDKVNSLK
jgi:sodium/proline symporter